MFPLNDRGWVVCTFPDYVGIFNGIFFLIFFQRDFNVGRHNISMEAPGTWDNKRQILWKGDAWYFEMFIEIALKEAIFWNIPSKTIASLNFLPVKLHSNQLPTKSTTQSPTKIQNQPSNRSKYFVIKLVSRQKNWIQKKLFILQFKSTQKPL
jgi:hypothetical protein